MLVGFLTFILDLVPVINAHSVVAMVENII